MLPKKSGSEEDNDMHKNPVQDSKQEVTFNSTWVEVGKSGFKGQKEFNKGSLTFLPSQKRGTRERESKPYLHKICQGY